MLKLQINKKKKKLQYFINLILTKLKLSCYDFSCELLYFYMKIFFVIYALLK